MLDHFKVINSLLQAVKYQKMEIATRQQVMWQITEKIINRHEKAVFKLDITLLSLYQNIVLHHL